MKVGERTEKRNYIDKCWLKRESFALRSFIVKGDKHAKSDGSDLKWFISFKANLKISKVFGFAFRFLKASSLELGSLNIPSLWFKTLKDISKKNFHFLGTKDKRKERKKTFNNTKDMFSLDNNDDLKEATSFEITWNT